MERLRIRVRQHKQIIGDRPFLSSGRRVVKKFTGEWHEVA